MKRSLLGMLGGAILALSLGACAMLPDNSTTADAKKGVQVALTTYTQIYQPAVIAYGRLPLCPAAVLCHDKEVFAQLAAADAVVNVAADAARKVMTENYNDPNALSRVVAAIQDAQLKIAQAGILKKE